MAIVIIPGVSFSSSVYAEGNSSGTALTVASTLLAACTLLFLPLPRAALAAGMGCGCDAPKLA